ncbi:hypothetical protein MMC25_004242 [Agyrium rufum]|nr:hypothetical protein [Agyrium rufum]
MARGNQRDKAREKNLKDQAGKTGSERTTMRGKDSDGFVRMQQSGTEFARTKEAQAAIMQAKQKAADDKRKADAAAAGK